MSLAAHAGFLLLILIGLSVHETPVDTKHEPFKLNAVYIPMTGPAGGGGGNTGRTKVKAAEIPKHDLPKPVPVTPQPSQPEPPRDPIPVLDVTIQTNPANVLQAPGTSIVSLGPGGTGGHDGLGRGRGSGVDEGVGGRTGGGPMFPGGDVTDPTLIRSVDPAYTAGALAAKISGTVELEVVVLTNGTVGPVRVTKSLDSISGLDQEAINAARQWLFRPSLQQGKPVEVFVKLILEFRIR